jgi:predicted enzyme related to lactoylglutathione lyase
MHKEARMDFKLELVLIPVTDVDRAKHFYEEKCASRSTSTISRTTSSASSS